MNGATGLERAVDTQECPSCGAHRTQQYCGACGEKGVDHHDYSIKHFLHHASHEFLHVDGKIFRTLKVLITEPGKLTQEYFCGRRLPYVNPLRLMLVLAALYIFVVSFNHEKSLFNIGNVSGNNPVIRHLAERIGRKQSIAVEVVMSTIEQRYHHAVSVGIVASPVLLAVAMQLIYRRRYYVEQLIFSLHFLSFVFVLGVATWPVTLMIGLPSVSHVGIVWKVLVFLANCGYMYLAVRRYYQESAAAALAKTAYTALSYFVSVGVVYMASLSFALIYTTKHGV
jgi:Protein of unknown function (DUF3667)